MRTRPPFRPSRGSLRGGRSLSREPLLALEGTSGLTRLSPRLIQDGYRGGEAFFIEGATLGPEPTLQEKYEEELRKYTELEEEYERDMYAEEEM